MASDLEVVWAGSLSISAGAFPENTQLLYVRVYSKYRVVLYRSATEVSKTLVDIKLPLNTLPADRYLELGPTAHRVKGQLSAAALQPSSTLQ